MSSVDSRISIRSFRDGDEIAAARLFDESLAGFVGAAPTTPDSWRRQHQVSWRSPVLGEDPDCFRVAERAGEVIGYMVVECPCRFEPDLAVIQELCVADGEDADQAARLLVSAAEQLATGRGVAAIVLHLSHEHGLSHRLAAAAGYGPPEAGTGVFMAAITNLPTFLEEIEEELTNRLLASKVSDWQGVVHLVSGDQSAKLLLADRRVRVMERDDGPAFSVEISPEVLAPLLFGRTSVREAFLQDRLSLSVRDDPAALAVLDALLPRVPIYLPMSQWW